jgi:hypothetical protein
MSRRETVFILAGAAILTVGGLWLAIDLIDLYVF